MTCSRVRSNHSIMPSILAPASRFSKTVATGMRVPGKTQAPLTFPGMLSTEGHLDQSSADMKDWSHSERKRLMTSPIHSPCPAERASMAAPKRSKCRARPQAIVHAIYLSLSRSSRPSGTTCQQAFCAFCKVPASHTIGVCIAGFLCIGREVLVFRCRIRCICEQTEFSDSSD